MRKGKTAFLALTYKSFQKEDLMKRFFNEKDSHLYNLYIHPKEDITDNYFSKYCIDASLRIKTEWGYYSLVQAACILLEEALKDPLNERFILISDSHLPLYNMKDMTDILFSHADVLSFNFLDSRLAKYRFYKMLKMQTDDGFVDIPFSLHCASYVSQWFVCNRSDASVFVEAERKYRQYFKQDELTIADESWFAVIAKHYKLRYQDRSFCFSDWDWDTDEYMISKGCKKNPHTFGHVESCFVDERRSYGEVFIRKVHRETVVDENYLFNEKYK